MLRWHCSYTAVFYSTAMLVYATRNKNVVQSSILYFGLGRLVSERFDPQRPTNKSFPRRHGRDLSKEKCARFGRHSRAVIGVCYCTRCFTYAVIAALLMLPSAVLLYSGGA